VLSNLKHAAHQQPFSREPLSQSCPTTYIRWITTDRARRLSTGRLFIRKAPHQSCPNQSQPAHIDAPAHPKTLWRGEHRGTAHFLSRKECLSISPDRGPGRIDLHHYASCRFSPRRSQASTTVHLSPASGTPWISKVGPWKRESILVTNTVVFSGYRR